MSLAPSLPLRVMKGLPLLHEIYLRRSMLRQLVVRNLKIRYKASFLGFFWTLLNPLLMATIYGLFMTPLGWGWALVVWGYAIAWFLVSDRIKLAAYRMFDPTQPGLLDRLSK